jgi:hypothetical protein
MQGCCVKQRATWLALVLFVFGCAEEQTDETQADSESSELQTRFDPSTAGTIRGEVLWEGPVPSPARLEIFPIPAGSPRLVRENPNAPVVDGHSKGVGKAVVFLRGVDPDKARPWDHSPVRVEQQDRRLIVRQGQAEVRAAFVRRGEEIEMVSRDHSFYSLRARGSAFFTFTFPDPEKPRRRTLDKKGLVELGSGAGHYWMRGYLFVDDHPYYARTDAQGRFELTQVPPGRYQVVCWLPNWNVRRKNLAPETALVDSVIYAEPWEQEEEVVLEPGGEGRVQFTVRESDFRR